MTDVHKCTKCKSIWIIDALTKETVDYCWRCRGEEE
jgi:Zn-finger nucleic acid-binding protein